MVKANKSLNNVLYINTVSIINLSHFYG